MSGNHQDDDNAPSPSDELSQLLEELRVMLPGIQVLFAFLLTVPFTQRFTEITHHQQTTYYMAVLTAGTAAILLISPSAIHRIQRHATDNELRRLLRTSTVLAITGSVVLATALTTVMYLITHILYGSSYAAVAAAFVGGLAALLWFCLPLVLGRS